MIRRAYLRRLTAWSTAMVLAATGAAFAQCYPGLGDCVPSSSLHGGSNEQAHQRSYWTHNGSLVYMTADGDNREFHYEDPRESIRAVGAAPGALLFKGQRNGANYAGTAYVFTKRCGPIPYYVRGGVSHDQRRVTLKGEAPAQIREDCKVAVYKDDTLVFDFVRAE